MSQEVDGEEKVIAFWSQQLNKAERNYSTVEREALAVVAAINHIYMAGRSFYLLTTIP